jgi:RsiW-degrading membrane proteinase PrsW (M82 family)
MNGAPTSWNDTQKLLAFMVVGALVVVVFVWMLYPPKEADPGSLAVLNMLIGALVGLATTVVTFYFGSSRGERTKDAATAAAANGVAAAVAAEHPGALAAAAAAPVPPPTPVG